jgi:hypothetical protein
MLCEVHSVGMLATWRLRIESPTRNTVVHAIPYLYIPYVGVNATIDVARGLSWHKLVAPSQLELSLHGTGHDEGIHTVIT